MGKKKFICFIGLDGSGKSSQAKFLYENLHKNQKKVKFVYGRFIPYLSKLSMNIGRRIFLNNKNNDDYKTNLTNKRKIIKNKSILAKFYFSLIFLETFIQIIIKIKIPLSFGYGIVADRYIHDTIINEFSVDLDLSIEESNALLEKILKFVPYPDFTFFIDISEETALKRKQDIPSSEYLKIRSKYYRSLKLDKMFIINGEKDLNEIQEIILEKLNS
jgi:thymidylate kinase